MENGINWEPQSVSSLAEALSRIGNEYRTAIADIYSSFNKLGTEQQWVGKNFNSIANDLFNYTIQSFDEWANFLQITIPQTVYQIAEAQAEIGGGSVYFSLVANTTEITSIQPTLDRGDGSQILEPDIVRAEINNALPSNCEIATARLQDYYAQFEELGTLNGNSAILEMYNQLDSIITKNRSILQAFQDEVQNTVERSVERTELTNEETRQLASRLSSILNV